MTGTKRKPAIRVEMEVGWWSDAKFQGLTWPVIRLWLSMIDYCRIQGTDGHIPDSAIGASIGGHPRTRMMVELLFERGLVARCGTGFQVPAYLKHNRPHAYITSRAERTSERTRKHRSRPPGNRGDGDVVSLSPTEREGDRASARGFEATHWRGKNYRRPNDGGDTEVEFRPDEWRPALDVDSSLDVGALWNGNA